MSQTEEVTDILLLLGTSERQGDRQYVVKTEADAVNDGFAGDDGGQGQRVRPQFRGDKVNYRSNPSTVQLFNCRY